MIPAFAIRWFKDTSPGHIRSAQQPNRRIQDGPKQYWLCVDCEQRFSSWERPFSEKIFNALVRHGPGQVRPSYGPWALKFACSISWRVLLFCREQGLDYLGPSDLACADAALQVWREYLLDRQEHPGVFEQHLLHLDAPASVEGHFPSPGLGRYMLRCFDLDVVKSRRTCFTYAKLGPVAIFGIIRLDRRADWKGTKLHVREGAIGATQCEIPGLIAKYWNDRADLVLQSLRGLSPQQFRKIQAVFKSADPDVLAASEVFRAMRADVQLSGNAAFTGSESDLSPRSD